MSMIQPDHIAEPSRQIPVSGDYEVVVVGGGIAGVAAAVAAARCSARVCLIERYCALGGLATLGNVTMWLPICDGRGKQVIAGLGEELLKLSVADLPRDYTAAMFRRVPSCWSKEGSQQERCKHRYRADFNPASYFLALEKFLVDAGVTLLYDTRFCAVRRQESGLSHIIIENKSGRSALAARTFVDATGDADVCFAAGEETQSLDSNVLAGWFYTLAKGELTLHHLSKHYSPLAEIEGADGPFFRGDDAAQVTSHLLQTRTLLRERLARTRANHPGDDIQVVMPATLACFRMTRRLVADFSLGEKHMHEWFEDTVGLTGDWRKPGPIFALPLRCLQARKCNNLLTAGRCISSDTTVWDVTRAIPTCVVTGQAAGTAAALAAQHAQGDLRALDFRLLKTRLVEQGVLLNPALVAETKETLG